MKKTTFSFFALVFLLFPHHGNGQKKHANCALEQLNLKGNVKLLENRQYVAISDSGKVIKGKQLFTDDTYTVHYDNAGNMVKSFITDYEGNLINYGEYILDNMNYRIEEKTYDGQKKLLNHTQNENKYDQNGNIVEISSTSRVAPDMNTLQKSKVQYEYDSAGNRVLSTSIDSHNKPQGKTIYRYNEDNRLTVEILFRANGDTLARDLYGYDKNGNRILWEHYFSDGKLISRTKQKYDSLNNLAEHLMYERRNGKWVMAEHLKFAYDSLNNRIEELVFDAKGFCVATLTSRYTYDVHGNWIENIQYSNNKPISIKERIFEYY